MIHVETSPNIALIKYWGKENEIDIKPLTSSISLCIKDFKTTTEIIENNEDVFILNDKYDKDENIKIFNFVDYIFSNLNIKRNKKIKIVTSNNFLTAAGLSSSSSGMANLTKAINEFFSLNLGIEDMIRLTRKGSGSSCRSFFNDFTVWKTNNKVFKLKNPFKLKFICIVISSNKKSISSRIAMKKCVEESRIFNSFLIRSEKAYKKALFSIRTRNFKLLSKISYNNFIDMHNTTKYINQPFTYISNESKNVLKFLNKININSDFLITMDAGSNVKIFVEKNKYIKLLDKLEKNLKEFEIITSDIL